MKNDLRRAPHAQVTAARQCRSHSHAKSVSPRLGGSSLGPRPPHKDTLGPSSSEASLALSTCSRSFGNVSFSFHQWQYRRKELGNRIRDGGRLRPRPTNPKGFPDDKAFASRGAASSNLNNPEGSGESLESQIPSRVNHNV